MARYSFYRAGITTVFTVLSFFIISILEPEFWDALAFYCLGAFFMFSICLTFDLERG